MAEKAPSTKSRKRSLEGANSAGDVLTISDNEEETIPECAVCLQECSHPCRLPCGHIFCFLCVKGVTLNLLSCPMCRAAIPRGYLDNPDLLSIPKKKPEADAEGYKWYYEGRNGGWWEYDARTSVDLEEAFKSKEKSIQVLIAGTVYVIDLVQMIQKKSSGRSSRKIKRSNSVVPTKGVAGILKHRQLPATPPREPTFPMPIIESYISDLDDYDFDDDDDDDHEDHFFDETDSSSYDDADDHRFDAIDHRNEPEVISDNEPEIISDNEPEIISDDEPQVISDDEPEIDEPEIDEPEIDEPEIEEPEIDDPDEPEFDYYDEPESPDYYAHDEPELPDYYARDEPELLDDEPDDLYEQDLDNMYDDFFFDDCEDNTTDCDFY